nr:condensation domain-containing protein [uncultured Sutterella sp.]
MAEGGDAYALPEAYELDADIDFEKLALAFQEVQKRHDALRTVFAASPEGEVRQQVSRLPLAVFENLGDLSPEEAQAAIAANRRHAFDLEHGPLVLIAQSPAARLQNSFLARPERVGAGSRIFKAGSGLDVLHFLRRHDAHEVVKLALRLIPFAPGGCGGKGFSIESRKNGRRFFRMSGSKERRGKAGGVRERKVAGPGNRGLAVCSEMPVVPAGFSKSSGMNEKRAQALARRSPADAVGRKQISFVFLLKTCRKISVIGFVKVRRRSGRTESAP